MGMRSPVRSHFCLEVEERRFLLFPSNSANSCFTPYAYGGNVRVAPSQETREHSRHLSSVSPCLRGEIPFSVWDAIVILLAFLDDSFSKASETRL